MKNFETVTELEILRAAKWEFLAQWDKTTQQLKQNPDNSIAAFRAEKYQRILDELAPRIIELEKQTREHAA